MSESILLYTPISPNASLSEDEKNIDKTDTEESHSTAADGGNPQVEEDNPTTTPSTGILPDSETLSENEPAETDSEKIADK